MVNKFRNIKLMHGIIFMLVLALLFITIIGVFGYYNMKKIHSSQDEMYLQRFLPTVFASSIKSDILGIRLYITKAIDDKYSNDLSIAIEANTSHIISLITKLENSKPDYFIIESLTTFKKNFAIYCNTWKDIIIKLENGEQLSDEEKTKFKELENTIVDNISNIVNFNEQEAEQLDISSDNHSKQITYVFSTVSILAAILLLLISLSIINYIRFSTKEIITSLNKVADGNFSEEIDSTHSNEFGLMKRSLAETIEKVSHIVRTIKKDAKTISELSDNLASCSEQMISSSQEVTTTVQEIAKTSNSQAEELSIINTNIHEFGIELDNIVKSIDDVEVSARKTGELASEDSKKLEDLTKSIHLIITTFNDVTSKISSLGHSINQINNITGIINNIANQTNLLALNAAIEAARAGEAGAGFAVVADEIRKLAEQSKTSANSIVSLVDDVHSEVTTVISNTGFVSKDLVQQTGIIEDTLNSFKSIVDSISTILPKIENVNVLALNIISKKDTIISKVEEVAALAQQSSASSQEIAASSEEMNTSSQEVAVSAQVLNDMTKDMITQVNKFQII